MSAPDQFEVSRQEKLRRIEELGVDPWGSRFDNHLPIGDIRQLNPEAEPSERVRAAGRVMQRRIQGKVHFLDLWDWSGRIQLYLGQKQIGEPSWSVCQNIDLGDLIAVEGEFKKTRMGELTIFVDKLQYQGKSLEPHPDKWAGMQDMEYRLRHRYLDLTYTPETLDRARKRVKIIRAIRNYLDDRGFWEVETPTLHLIAGGAAARPFLTHHNTLDLPLYMRIALELHLKRLMTGGIERVYEIGRVFRNEGISHKHNPEFTMMELYQAYGDYRAMMDLTEGMIVNVIDMLGEGRQLPYGEATIDFTPPWQRASYGDLFRQHVGVAMEDTDAMLKAGEATGFPIMGKHPDVVIHHLFETKVEPHLVGPVFVHDYPASLCPLTKRKRDNPNIAERFELYIQKMELANAYTELNDPITQEATFRTQLAGLPEEDSMAKMDEDFIRSQRHGMPPAGGLGVGIDRLVMLLTNTQTIRDVILFPLLRPEVK